MGEKKRECILHAAEGLFLSSRYDKVTLDQVCQEAGVGKGTIYRYFEGKEDLYAQMVLQGLDDLGASLEAAASGPAAPDQKLKEVLETLDEFHRKRHALFELAPSGQFRRMVKGRGTRSKYMARRREVSGWVAAVIAEGIEQGAYRPEIESDDAAVMFVGMAHACLWASAKEDRASPSDRLVDIFLHGIRRQ
jgi:AcrR family transcriptional regulator